MTYERAGFAFIVGAVLLLATETAHAQPRREAAFLDIALIASCAVRTTYAVGDGLWHGGQYADHTIERVVEGRMAIYRNKRGAVCGSIRFPDGMSLADERHFYFAFEEPAIAAVFAIYTPAMEGERARQEQHVQARMAHALARYGAEYPLPEISVGEVNRRWPIENWLAEARSEDGLRE